MSVSRLPTFHWMNEQSEFWPWAREGRGEGHRRTLLSRGGGEGEVRGKMGERQVLEPLKKLCTEPFTSFHHLFPHAQIVLFPCIIPTLAWVYTQSFGSYSAVTLVQCQANKLACHLTELLLHCLTLCVFGGGIIALYPTSWKEGV